VELATGTARIADLDSFVEELDRIGEATGCAVQAFDARYVVGPEQLERAVALANRSFDRGENVARERSVEILLYAAGRRQINRALEIGVNEEGDGVEGTDGNGDGDPVVIVVDGDDESAALDRLADGELIDPDDWEAGERADPGLIREFYGITDAERAATDAALVDLVCERVALLEVEK
jgi:KEOPS complex subunit Cgi121